MICPEGDFDSLEGIPYRESNYISLLLIGITIFVGDLFLYPLNDADHIHHLTLRPFVLMLPAIIFEFVSSLHRLVLDLVNLVLFVLKTDLGGTFDLLSMEELNPPHEINSTSS